MISCAGVFPSPLTADLMKQGGGGGGGDISRVNVGETSDKVIPSPPTCSAPTKRFVFVKHFR